jgi:hypothetical protein
MKTFAISIPKPCHEDWNKMTPDEKGAFCGSCQKSVYDFSNKTDEEIISVFEKEEKGKVCGRFTSSQLSRPVVSFGNPTATSRLAIFAYALLLVFGSALFSGANAYGQEYMKKGEVKVKMMGKPAITEIKSVTIPEEEKPVIKCALNKNPGLMSLGQTVVVEQPIKITGDTIIEEINVVEPVEEVEMITGEMMAKPLGAVEFEEDLAVIETAPPVEDEEPLNMIAGGVSYYEMSETAPEILTPADTTDVVTAVIKETEELIPLQVIEVKEEVLPVEDNTEEHIEENDEDRSWIAAENIIAPSSDFAVKVSPNPSRGEITLSYILESMMAVRIDLYDNSGKLVRTLANQEKQYAGKYNSYYNIGDLRNGTYTAVMSTSDRKVSAKVVLVK